jgi:ASC-1-like (ASCH) protein
MRLGLANGCGPHRLAIHPGAPRFHHIAVVLEPYAELILRGRKRIECRFSSVRKPPFGCVRRGDKLWFKISSGPLVAVARVQRVLYFHPVASDTVRAIYSDYGQGICADSKFYRDCRRAQYVTLVLFGPARGIHPVRQAKSDRRAWVITTHPPGYNLIFDK